MPNKVLQLNQIIDDLLANQSLYLEDHEADEDERSEKRAKSSATPRKPWWPFDIRHAMQEYVADFQDGVHTGGSGRTIYAQMLAYYIKMLT